MLDECMAVLMLAPRTYTREDVAEFHLHGGDQIAREALAALYRLGARPAEPGEFTRRAFLNGRVDLSRAEAVMDVIGAQGEQAARAALRQLNGGASAFIRDAQQRLTDLLAGVAAALDYPEEIEEAEAAGSVIAGAMGLLVLILSDGQADALWACAMLIGAAACFLGVSRRGMLLCSLMGMLVAQGAAGVSGVLRADVQPWTDAALLCASVSTALAEIVRRTAIFLLTPPGVKGGHRG